MSPTVFLNNSQSTRATPLKPFEFLPHNVHAEPYENWSWSLDPIPQNWLKSRHFFDFRFLVKLLVHKTCHNSMAGNRMSMKFESKSKQNSAKQMLHITSNKYTRKVMFLTFLPELERYGRWVPTEYTTLNSCLATFNLNKNKNRIKKSSSASLLHCLKYVHFTVKMINFATLSEKALASANCELLASIFFQD